MKNTFRKNWNEFVLGATGLAVIIRFLNNPGLVKGAVSSLESFMAVFLSIVSFGIIGGTAIFWIWYFLRGRKIELNQTAEVVSIKGIKSV